MSARRKLRAFCLLLGGVACVADSAPETTFVDCSTCPRMVIIPGGSFTMGSPPTEPERRRFEGPRAGVTVATFAIGETEVTRAQYEVFVKDTKRTDTGCFTYGFSSFRDPNAIDPNASWRNPGFEQTAEHPAVCVSWRDATDYAAWLARKTGRPYRLPSEAEWEYAARAGTTTVFFWGNDEERGCAYANGGDATLLRVLPQLHEEIAFTSARRRGRTLRRMQRRQRVHQPDAETSTERVRAVRRQRQRVGVCRRLLAGIPADQ
jgi:formylglycine-generating enzyme required for sulfatase activity